MSGSREYIRNGQPHFITPQTVVNFRRKKSKRSSYIVIPLVLFVITCCVGFIGCLYYLNLKFQSEVQEYNEKINRQMQLLTDKLNLELSEYKHQVDKFRTKLDELQKNKDDKKQFTDTQKLLQESESNKFKGIAVENVEEFPDIEDIEEGDLITVHDQRNTDAIEQPNPRKNHLDDGLLHKLHSPNITLKKDKTTSSMEERLQEDIHENKRHRRGAELPHSDTYNTIETSREQFENRNKLPNQTELQTPKNSPSQNQTCVERKQQGSPCNEAIPRKTANLQKNTGKRSLQYKKSLNLQDQTTINNSEELNENADITEVQRTVIAAHFGADSSRYSVRTHAHYEGNGHLRHPTGEYEDWRPSAWFDELNMHKHFVLLNGNIKVHSPGLYFVYAQIFYSDLSDVNGYAIFLNSQIVLQCITSTFTFSNVTSKSNTCFTGGVIKCNAGDKISVKTIDVNRKVILESTRSFIGMFKIGEFQTIK